MRLYPRLNVKEMQFLNERHIFPIACYIVKESH